MSFADSQFMAEKTQSAAQRTTSPRQQVPDPDLSVASALWVIPAPVLLTGDQIVAALYAFSELIDECADPTIAAVGEEVRFLVARHGADPIERIAEWIEARGTAPLPDSLRAGAARVERNTLSARLAWCLRQSKLLLAADA